MNDQQILWLVIGVVVLLVIIAIALVVGYRRRARRREADRLAAEQLRDDAARQQERTQAEEEAAAASRRKAEAAEEEARRLRAEAEEGERSAGRSRTALESQLHEADRLDPEVQTDRSGHRKDGVDPIEELDARSAQASSETVQPAGEESPAEHDIVERRIAPDPADEPHDSVAAEQTGGRDGATGRGTGKHAAATTPDGEARKAQESEGP